MKRESSSPKPWHQPWTADPSVIPNSMLFIRVSTNFLNRGPRPCPRPVLPDWPGCLHSGEYSSLGHGLLRPGCDQSILSSVSYSFFIILPRRPFSHRDFCFGFVFFHFLFFLIFFPSALQKFCLLGTSGVKTRWTLSASWEEDPTKELLSWKLSLSQVRWLSGYTLFPQKGRNKDTKDAVCLVLSIWGPLQTKSSPYGLHEPLNS